MMGQGQALTASRSIWAASHGLVPVCRGRLRCADTCYVPLMSPCSTLRVWGADAVVSAAMGLPWADLLFMGLGTTAFTLWVSQLSLLLVYCWIMGPTS